MPALRVNSGTATKRSTIPRQLPFSPMVIFAIGAEHPLDVPI
jgi:hypothetical protein